VDWHARSFHFESVNKTTPKYKKLPTSTLDFEHDFASADPTRISHLIQKLKCEKDIGGNQGSKHFKLLFMGVRAFI
jgi:hypothetical protein